MPISVRRDKVAVRPSDEHGGPVRTTWSGMVRLPPHVGRLLALRVLQTVANSSFPHLTPCTPINSPNIPPCVPQTRSPAIPLPGLDGTVRARHPRRSTPPTERPPAPHKSPASPGPPYHRKIAGRTSYEAGGVVQGQSGCRPTPRCRSRCHSPTFCAAPAGHDQRAPLVADKTGVRYGNGPGLDVRDNRLECCRSATPASSLTTRFDGNLVGHHHRAAAPIDGRRC